MQSTAQGTAAPLRLGAILSLLMLLMLLSAPIPAARAGCSGHYLTSRTQAVAEKLALGSLVLGESGLPAQGERSPSRPTPCSGALCSGNPAVPLSTVPVVTPQGDGDWAISVRRPVLADPGSIGRLAEDALFVPVDNPSSIFHPPRRPTLRPWS
jgi:hypothetical protein